MANPNTHPATAATYLHVVSQVPETSFFLFFLACDSDLVEWCCHRLVLRPPRIYGQAILASRPISVLKCSRLKQGSRDGHPELESYFHDRCAATFKLDPLEDPNRCTWAISVRAQQLNSSDQGHCRLAKAPTISKPSNNVYKPPTAVGTVNHNSLFFCVGVCDDGEQVPFNFCIGLDA